MTVRIFAGMTLAVFLAGCQTAKPIYYWGNYEALAYQSYATPGKASAEQQIEKLKEDLEKAKAANLPIHPGLHAHLGYLYTQTGKSDLALQEFEIEKKLFPESVKFIDGLLAQAKPAAKP